MSGRDGRVRRGYQPGWCPTLSTLVLKSSTLFASRTHGHHFREERWTTFRVLSDDELWELVEADPEAVEEALVRRTTRCT
jgi:hypothetical protein